jgi:hypothetical protein
MSIVQIVNGGSVTLSMSHDEKICHLICYREKLVVILKNLSS